MASTKWNGNLISEVHVKQAAQLWGSRPNRIKSPFRNSLKYDVYIDGKPYPPKAICAIAYKLAAGIELIPSQFVGAKDGYWHQVLKALGFEIYPKSASPSSGSPDIDLLTTAIEGGLALANHLRRERKPQLIEAKKADVLRTTGQLCCEACGFGFYATYGDLGKGFCEVHHITPLSSLNNPVETKLSDLAVLCSNCHRMIHRSDPMISVIELSKLLKRLRGQADSYQPNLTKLGQRRVNPSRSSRKV